MTDLHTLFKSRKASILALIGCTFAAVAAQFLVSTVATGVLLQQLQQLQQAVHIAAFVYVIKR
jgi:hypothetical protein